MSLPPSPIVRETADRIKASIGDNDIVDVGRGAAEILGVSAVKLQRAVTLLSSEGYRIFYIPVQQLTFEDKKTAMKVLAKEPLTFPDVMKRRDEIKELVVDAS